MNRLLALLLFVAACNSAPRPSGAPKGLVDAAPLRTDWTPEELQASCAEAEKTSDAKLVEVVGIPDAKRTFANTPEAIEQVTADWGEAVSRADFMKNIHVDEKVRAA
ncbi:MAG: Zn-dependent oligopeptidase, partial [Deltaproteobacteria bacterium]